MLDAGSMLSLPRGYKFSQIEVKDTFGLRLPGKVVNTCGMQADHVLVHLGAGGRTFLGTFEIELVLIGVAAPPASIESPRPLPKDPLRPDDPIGNPAAVASVEKLWRILDEFDGACEVFLPVPAGKNPGKPSRPIYPGYIFLPSGESLGDRLLGVGAVDVPRRIDRWRVRSLPTING